MMPESRFPQRVESRQPGITLTMRELGLLDRLAPCTRYCLDVCPELRDRARQGKPRAVVHDSWTSKADEILGAKPDLVVLQFSTELEQPNQF